VRPNPRIAYARKPLSFDHLPAMLPQMGG